MTNELETRLVGTIAKSEAVFLSKVHDLEFLRKRVVLKCSRARDYSIPVTEQSVREWLSKVTHNPRGKHRKLQVYATAYTRQQKIVYNPLFLEKQNDRGTWDEYVFDMVLHELGHLFTVHFYKQIGGHDWTWQTVGTIVGYAPVGSTSDYNRARHKSFAAHASSVATVESAPVARIESTGGRVNPGSTVRRPVDAVWYYCRSMPNAARKDVIAACVAAGVNKNTAATQYAAWKKQSKMGYN